MDVGTIIGGAFRLVRDRWRAVAVWAGLYLALTVALRFAMQPLMAAQVATLQQGPGAAAALIGGFTATFVALELLAFVLVLMISTAAVRAALTPERSSFAYLRLGMDELRVVGLSLLLGLIGLALLVAVSIVAGVLGGVLAAALRGGPFVAVGVVLLLFVPLWLASIWLQVRISPALPLTILRGRITVREAWRLTKGRFWTLFGAYLVVGLIVGGAALVLFSLIMGSYFTDLAQSMGDPAATNRAMAAQLARQAGPPGPAMVIGWIGSAVFSSVGLTLVIGVVCSATRELLGTGGARDYAEVFG